MKMEDVKELKEFHENVDLTTDDDVQLFDVAQDHPQRLKYLRAMRHLKASNPHAYRKAINLS